jgi:5-methylcytosine-specific restriction endonuclease McrA
LILQFFSQLESNKQRVQILDTLILNADYRPLNFLPISVIPWQQAVKLTVLGRINVLEHYSDWEVHSPSITIKVPALAITREFMKYKQRVCFSRRGVYLRDLYTCGYCDEVFPDSELTLDHVVPISKGGKTNWENIVTACKKCNFKKGDKIIQPNQLPYKPEYWYIVGNSIKNNRFQIRHESWRPFLQPKSILDQKSH